jgi:hypothetical protein
MNEKQIVSESAFGKGYAFGKYTQDVLLKQDILDLLENSNELMNIFRLEFNNGFIAGQADTKRD